MEYTKPRVTIDLDEYNELKEGVKIIKEQSFNYDPEYEKILIRLLKGAVLLIRQSRVMDRQEAKQKEESLVWIAKGMGWNLFVEEHVNGPVDDMNLRLEKI